MKTKHGFIVGDDGLYAADHEIAVLLTQAQVHFLMAMMHLDNLRIDEQLKVETDQESIDIMRHHNVKANEIIKRCHEAIDREVHS